MPTTYTVEVIPDAKKQLAKLPTQDQARIAQALLELRQTPRPDGVKKLKGKQTGLYRIRLGSYRVIYSINDKVLHVIVVWIGQRGGAYK
jgi:mRNA interferase RelE/StbE